MNCPNLGCNSPTRNAFPTTDAYITCTIAGHVNRRPRHRAVSLAKPVSLAKRLVPTVDVAIRSGLPQDRPTCSGSGRPLVLGSQCQSCDSSFGFPHPFNGVVGRPAPTHRRKVSLSKPNCYLDRLFGTSVIGDVA